MARYIEVYMLGTGGSVPTAERMTSCILVKDWLGFHVLLDVGEGCQLRLQQAGVSPASIDVVALTHSHGDHVNGLAGLVQTMTLQDRSKELLIIGARDAVEFAEESLEVTRLRAGFSIRTLAVKNRGSVELQVRGGDTLALSWSPACHSIESYAFRLEWSLRARVDVAKLEALGLKPGSWLRELFEKKEVEVGGRMLRVEDVALEPPRSFSVTYSGDTTLCDSVVELARGSHLLIHEATFSARDSRDASEAYHSTSLDAATAALEARVAELILTHVSGRYRGFEARVLEREARQLFPRARLAWDLMRLRFIV
ncbi:MAG: MBL fold metallo-hydrolase [Acidilobaceae archaeon]